MRSESDAMSPTIKAVIAERLEHLSSLGRELVSQASILGRAFTFQVLARASHIDEDALIQGLDELWRRRIIREQGNNAYDFSHDRLREVAYTALSAAHRRVLHRRAADAYQMVYADRLDTVSGLMAAHYEQAGVVERAVTCYQRAAEVAQQLYANAEALHCYQRALALLESASSQQAQQELWRAMSTQIYESLGDLCTLIAQLEQARDAYQEALVRTPKHQCITQAHLHRKVGLAWKTQRCFEEALQSYSTAEAILEGERGERTSGWWQEWIDILGDRIEIHYWEAHVPEMKELVEKTRPVVERCGTRIQRASFFERLWMMNMRRDRYVVSEETLEFGRASLTARLELGDENAIAWARFSLGFTYLWHGDFDLAEEQLQAVRVMSEKTGDATLQSRNLTYLMVLARKRGQVQETQQLSVQALALATALHLPEYIAMAKANLSWVAWREGNIPEARASGLAAIELWQPLQVVYMFQWAALWPLIAIELTQNQLSEAIDHARLLLVSHQQSLPRALHLLVETAIQSWDAGQLEAARTQLQQATILAQEEGYL